MRKTLYAWLFVTFLVAVTPVLLAAQTKPAPSAGAHPTLVAPDQVQWGPAPPALPPGAQAAVLDGDPAKPGLFSIRIKFPDGFTVPPHWHPTDEHVVVITGTFLMGAGDKVDPSSMHAAGPGGFAKIPARMHHYARAKGETIVQVYGTGPFELNYVNPGDDPRKKTTAQK